MNNRIKELMEQAGLYDFVIGSMGIDEEMNKFVELIIKDCIQQIDVRKNIAIDNDWNVDEAMSSSIMDIEDHFGIE